MFVNAWLNAKDRFCCSAQEWDRCVDPKWRRGSCFKIVESVIMGTMNEGDMMVA